MQDPGKPRPGLLGRLLPSLALALLAGACASAPRFREISIVHTNDLHGHVENAAAVAAVARAERARNPATLFLDAGDCITGTPLSTLYQGGPIFEVMSLMGYDAAALGNHEWDHGQDRIATFQEIATFPLLCANATGPDGSPFGDAASKVFEVGGIRIGVIGLVTEHVPTLTVASASAGCSFEKPIEAARRLVPALRKDQKCDVIVLLTHVGVQADAALAGAVPGVDLIIGGHSHTLLEKPLDVDGVTVVQAGSYGRHVGVLRLTWDRQEQRLSTVAWEVVAVDAETMPNAPDVTELVDAWESQVASRVDEVIGETDKRLGKKALRERLERIYREALGADFGYQNGGGIRADVKAGQIRIRDVFTVLPFDNTMVRLRLRGEQLPVFLQKRLGKALVADKEYVIATNSYVSDQRIKYFDAPDAPIEDTGLMMRDLVVDWVREHGGF